MKIRFLGAARCVTGSCHMLLTDMGKVLVDCGMRQGNDAQTSGDELPFDPTDIAAVLLTHAHIDHSGLLPLLVKGGFKGPIVSTTATAELCTIMLPDSGHIQESDAEYTNRKRSRQGKEPIEPLYTVEDAKQCLTHFRPCEYGAEVEVIKGVHANFSDAGHLLGSASISITVTEGERSTRLLFSGDVGRSDRPLVRDPQPATPCDYLIMEGTYGDRIHKEEGDKAQQLCRVIEEAFKKGGNVIIPSFAVGRTQEMLYYLAKIIRDKLSSLPEIPIYIDSPLGIEATKIYEKCAARYYDKEATGLIKRGLDPLDIDSVTVARSVDESKLINADKRPKVIISSSGMCEAGRIRHHLKHNLWRQESTILFVGYQAVGTIGRLLLDGKKRIKLFGEEIHVSANIERIEGFSGHADCDELLEWASAISPPPSGIFLVHGEDDVLDVFSQRVHAKLKAPVEIPNYAQEYVLDTGAKKGPAFSSVEVISPLVHQVPITDVSGLLEQSDRIYRLLRGLSSKEPADRMAQFKLELMAVDLKQLADKWETLMK